MSRIDYSEFPPKNFTCPWSNLRTQFTSPVAKSTSPGLSDTTFFVRWHGRLEMLNLSLSKEKQKEILYLQVAM